MKLASGAGNDLLDTALDVKGAKLIVSQLDGADAKSLPGALDGLKNKLGSGAVVLASVGGDRINLIAGVTKDLTDKLNAGELVNFVANQVGGKGGGRPDMERAGGSDIENLPKALDSVAVYVEERL